MEICAKGLFAKMNELQSFEELQSLINLEDLVDPRKSAGEAARAAAGPGSLGRRRSMSLEGHCVLEMQGAED